MALDLYFLRRDWYSTQEAKLNQRPLFIWSCKWWHCELFQYSNAKLRDAFTVGFLTVWYEPFFCENSCEGLFQVADYTSKVCLDLVDYMSKLLHLFWWHERDEQVFLGSEDEAKRQMELLAVSSCYPWYSGWVPDSQWPRDGSAIPIQGPLKF